MAMAFSSAASVRSLYHPKSLLTIRDSHLRGPNWANCQPTRANLLSWRSAGNYLRLQNGSTIVAKEFIQKRIGIVKCATLDEIEAEKSLIEKDVKERMEKTIETVRANFNAVRTGRANPAMLDRVEELSKVVAKQAEEGKVALRNIRRDAIKAYDKLEKEKKLSEDNVKDLSSDLQKLTDEYLKKLDSIYKQKEKELLKV
ncbi:ribosome-recycling factor, chloroplastic isoform X2 [Macadamia integrifolia]|uniref:ribosome-recycling factor, chloroplastic isoform X2 n=1 Tax=Macadamia integrifolia TaxID=60698 RepID=UPI001C4E94E5|nr:ribosome-recycling factor, chloroplastic isoform X2 [Macadamia integrifolia]